MHACIIIVGLYTLRQTYTKQLLVAGNTATSSSMHAVHGILHAIFYKSLGNRQVAYFRVTCRMYHAIFRAQRAWTMKLPCRQGQKLPCVCWSLGRFILKLKIVETGLCLVSTEAIPCT